MCKSNEGRLLPVEIVGKTEVWTEIAQLQDRRQLFHNRCTKLKDSALNTAYTISVTCATYVSTSNVNRAKSISGSESSPMSSNLTSLP
jgi:hypothetical protein